MQATELRIEAYLQLGRQLDVLPELKALTVRHPLHEGLHTRLMLALHRTGRRHEALQAYGGLRQALADDLGLEPSVGVQQVHRALLAGDPALEQAHGRMRACWPGTLAPPAQLPPDNADFCGRREELAGVERLLDPSADSSSPAPRIVTLCGMAGAGKTAFAIRVAHRMRRRYPDGQFFACLGASRPDDASAAPGPRTVIGSFLQGAGFLPEQIPRDLASRAQLFRSWCADRRVLVLLDDVASEEQVESLLPGAPDCGVVITSRSPLFGLSGTHRREMQPLQPTEAVDLLARVADRHWSVQELRLARAIAERCDNLPAALRSVGSRLAPPAGMSLERAVARLADPGYRLEVFGAGEANPARRLARSWRGLDDSCQRLLQGLSRSAASIFLAEDVALLLGLPRVTAEALLGRLHDRRLLLATDGPRYRLPDLVRLFVFEQERDLGPAHRDKEAGRNRGRHRPGTR